MYRILSLDGFGAWSLLQVRALQELYGAEAPGREVLARFDLVAAHASGRVVAAALAANWPLSKVMNLFLDEAPRRTVLVPAHCPVKGTNSGFQSAKTPSSRRYEALAALLHPLANIPLAELPEAVRTTRGGPVHFLFVGLDSPRQAAVMYRSDLNSAAAALIPSARVKLVEAVYAASNVAQEAASGFRRNAGTLCGIANPVMAAVTEALANGRTREEIEVLSLGTGHIRLSLNRSVDQTGSVYRMGAEAILRSEGLPELGCLADDPPDCALFMAHVALGQPLPSPKMAVPVGTGSVVRMSPMIEPIANSHGSVYLPNLGHAVHAPGLTSEAIFAALLGLGSNAAEQEQIGLIRALADSWVADRATNQPIRADSMGRCEIGHRWFSSARDAWLAREVLSQSGRGAAVLNDRQRVAVKPGHASFV